MTGRARIGELLSRLVPLSGHDVEEILHEQSNNPRRFGEIALAWGLCRPEHVWDAWCEQSADSDQLLDLEQVGVDARAAAMLPTEIARQHKLIPIRVGGSIALIASADAKVACDVLAHLEMLLHRSVKIVHVEREQLSRIIDCYYPLMAQAG